MTQTLTVELAIPIPADCVIIKRSELEELKQQELSGVYWTMKDLEKRVGRCSDWIKENILYPERFRKILDVQHGGFVYYPSSKGQPWTFQAAKMAQFLDERFNQIFGR